MKDEIYYGMKNALERGQNLNQAIQSFINAGYNPVEVRAAGKMISSEWGASSIAGEKTEMEAPAKPSEEGVRKLPKSDFAPPPKKNPNNGKKILIIGLLIILALVILGVIGFLIWYLLR
jgi:nitrate reductase NapE component